MIWQPFNNLRALDPDAPDIEWEYRRRQIYGNFLSAIEELYIITGEKGMEYNKTLTYNFSKKWGHIITK